jgi:hypothetical protein
MASARIDWQAIEANLRLGDTRYRYYRGRQRIALYTSARLYEGGDYLAALVERDGTVVRRAERPLRREASDLARMWSEGIAREYVIKEEP